MFSSRVPLIYCQCGQDSYSQCNTVDSAWRTNSPSAYCPPRYRLVDWTTHSEPRHFPLSLPLRTPKPNISKTLKFGIENILSSESDQIALDSSHYQSLSSDCRKPQRRRPWSRPVFTQLQRRGLEKRFQVQKYITKHDRYQLAGVLGLSETQVKVWFQNRRTKWRQDMKDTERKDDEHGEMDDEDEECQDDK